MRFVTVGSYGKRGGCGVPMLLKDTRTYISIDCIRTSSGLTLPLNKKCGGQQTLFRVWVFAVLWVCGLLADVPKDRRWKVTRHRVAQAVYPENKGLTVSDNLSIRLHRITERACWSVEKPNKCSPKNINKFLLEKRGQGGNLWCWKSIDFQSPKGGNVRKKVSPPYIKTKEVNPQGARKNRPKKTNKLVLFVSLIFAVALRRKCFASALLSYGRENRNSAESRGIHTWRTRRNGGFNSWGSNVTWECRLWSRWWLTTPKKQTTL